jgi:hypothetical protein
VTLRTRKPTNAVSWPLVLLAGEAKTGKTYAAAEFTGDPRVGRSFWLDLGEGCADEYGAVPGADYEIVEHDGTWVDIIDQVTEVREVAREALAKGVKPVSLTIDSMSAEWSMLSAWTDTRARRSKSNKARLEQDPDSEIDITSNYWNDANSRHNKLMNILKTFPGIVIMTALETEKTQFDAGGRPKQGAPKVAKPDAQKRLAADSTVWLRLSLENPPTLVGLRSVKFTIRPGVDKPVTMRDFNLATLLFEKLEVNATAQVRDVPVLTADQVAPDEDPNWEAKQQAAIKAAGAAVLAAGLKLGWDRAKVSAVYTSENNGADLFQATVKGLQEFEADLLSRTTDEPAGLKAVA